jgi:hypothetical protein
MIELGGFFTGLRAFARFRVQGITNQLWPL